MFIVVIEEIMSEEKKKRVRSVDGEVYQYRDILGCMDLRDILHNRESRLKCNCGS